MTTEELNTIVQAVIDKINGQVIDFDVAQSTPESTDLLSAVRTQGDGTYQGVTLKWDDVANAVTREAKGYRDDAASAKTNVENMKASVEQTVNDFNTLAEKKKTEVQGVYQTDLNELNGDLTITINDVKQELDDKKITKFYASNNGNTNLPDSDSGKPSDMKIFGKSVQDGTPSQSNPIEIQSVVNPVVRMMGKNLLNPKYSWVDNSGYTNDGVTYSYNTDKVLTLNGTKLGNSSGYIGCFELNLYFSGVLTITVFNYSDKTIADDVKVQISKKSNIGTLLVTNLNTLFGIIAVNGKTYDNKKYVIQIEQGNISNPTYKPYQEQSASLPYTLNAIPVSDGGNVTIDGQQYIADYVDVERKKLVRMVGSVDLGTLTWYSKESIASGFFTSGLFALAKGLCISRIYKSQAKSSDWDAWNDYSISHNDGFRGQVTGNTITNAIIIKDSSRSGKTSDEFKASLSGVICYYELATPTETDLTESDITALSSLATYYPITNASVASDQLDGHVIFNYPLNMANGWNYVMQQIGETRPIIYDTQVKTIENLIDTAILTAMMGA